jgi:hypothetical protein
MLQMWTTEPGSNSPAVLEVARMVVDPLYVIVPALGGSPSVWRS